MVTRKCVIFEFGKGSFQKGFPVTVKISTDGIDESTRIPDGFLPPSPISLTEETLEEWSRLFEERIKSFRNPNRAIKANESQTKNGNINFFEEQTKQLVKDVNIWLDSKDTIWSNIKLKICARLLQDDEVRIVIQTDNYYLRKMPWQTWEFFKKEFPKTEFIFSPSSQEKKVGNITSEKSQKAKILVILGNPSGGSLEKGQDKKIDYTAEINAINNLGMDPFFLRQPSHKDLIDKLCSQKWQIIFYSGHSVSEKDGSKGYLQLRENEIITIDDLKQSLGQSINKGLQLAIFNSCQGLGIVKQLEDLGLPYIIVMREKVLDNVAKEFLKDLLSAFAGGNGDRTLNDSLQETRIKLEDQWKNKIPGISWLPIICQQCADAKPLVFKNFLRQTPLVRKKIDVLLSQLSQAHIAGNIARAIELGEQILKIDTTNQTALTTIALAYNKRIVKFYDQAKYDEVIQSCNRGLILKPDFADFYYQRARAYYQKNNFQEVIENCTQAIKLEKQADYYIQRGIVYYKQENYDQAINDANMAISINEKKDDYHYLLGLSLYSKGYSILLKAKNILGNILGIYDQEKSNQVIELYTQSITALSQAITINPNKIANYYWVRGLCYLGIFKSDQAINDFNKANELDPGSKNYDYNYLLGLSYFQKKDYSYAICCLTLAVGYLSKNADCYYHLSLSYYNRDYSAEYNYAEFNNSLKNFPELKKFISQRFESDAQKAKETIEIAIEIAGYQQLEYLALNNKIEERIKQRISGRR